MWQETTDSEFILTYKHFQEVETRQCEYASNIPNKQSVTTSDSEVKNIYQLRA